MNTTPYRTTTVELVEPGNVVEHDLAPFVVDELRRTTEGWELLGWPRHRVGQGRRAAFTVDPGVEVKVLATAEDAATIAATVCDAIREYVKAWRSAAGGESPTYDDDVPVPPVDTALTSLVVRDGGHEWTVDLSW